MYFTIIHMHCKHSTHLDEAPVTALISPAARLWTDTSLLLDIAVRPCMRRVIRHSSSHCRVRTHSASFLSNSLQTGEEFM